MCSRKKTIILQNFLPLGRKVIMLSVASLLFFACKKDMAEPVSATTSSPVYFSGFQLSASKLVLLQGNENNKALTLEWKISADHPAPSINYTIEAAARGTQFADPVVLSSTDRVSVSLSVKEFNSKIRQVIGTGKASMVDLRIRAVRNNTNETVYSDAMALEVTPYQPFTDYDDSRIMRIPGNFQNWILSCAPKIVASGKAGEYEGYIHFTNPYPQFLMIKSATNWDTKVTYQNIGANKIGFGGSIFSVSGGAGVYRMKVNMENNTWSCTKINSWALTGTAVSADPNAEVTMIDDSETISWSITSYLAKGDFRFRANKSNDINLGHNPMDETGVPDYNAANIPINKAGNYTVRLHLKSPGNYAYSIQRNPS
jgi:hypothetical protein